MRGHIARYNEVQVSSSMEPSWYAKKSLFTSFGSRSTSLSWMGLQTEKKVLRQIKNTDIFFKRLKKPYFLSRYLRNHWMDHGGDSADLWRFLFSLDFSGLTGNVKLATEVFNFISSKRLIDPVKFCSHV